MFVKGIAKRSLLILSISFIGLLGWSQENRFRVGFGCFPNFSKGILSNDGSVTVDFEERIKSRETWKPSLAGNLFVEYKLNEFSFIGVGLGYQNNGEQTTKMTIGHSVDPQTGNFIIDPNSPISVRFEYNHHNLEVPLYYHHAFHKHFFAQAGLSGIVNFRNTSVVELYYVDESSRKSRKTDTSADYRKFNLSGNFGVGCNFITNDRISCFAMPQVQFGLIGVTNNTGLNRNMLSVGLSLGMRMS